MKMYRVQLAPRFGAPESETKYGFYATFEEAELKACAVGYPVTVQDMLTDESEDRQNCEE